MFKITVTSSTINVHFQEFFESESGISKALKINVDHRSLEKTVIHYLVFGWSIIHITVTLSFGLTTWS